MDLDVAGRSARALEQELGSAEVGPGLHVPPAGREHLDALPVIRHQVLAAEVATEPDAADDLLAHAAVGLAVACLVLADLGGELLEQFAVGARELRRFVCAHRCSPLAEGPRRGTPSPALRAA